MSIHTVIAVDGMIVAIESNDDPLGINWCSTGEVSADVSVRMADVETARGGSYWQGESSAEEGDCEYQDLFHVLVFFVVLGAGGCDARVPKRIRRKFPTELFCRCPNRNG